MSELTTSFQHFNSSMKALKEFELLHKDIFAQHRRLNMTIIDARAKLEDQAVMANKGIQGTEYEVILKPQSQTFADIGVINDLVKAGKIDPQYLDQIIKTEDRAPYVIIKPMA